MTTKLHFNGELCSLGGLFFILPQSKVRTWIGVGQDEAGHYDKLLLFFENSIKHPDYLDYFIDGKDDFLLCTSETKDCILLSGEDCFAIVELLIRCTSQDTPHKPMLVNIATQQLSWTLL